MNEIQKTEEKAMEFVPYGNQDKIKLTLSIIKNLIAVPTKSGKTCSDKDAMKFMMLCQAKRLNPFESDAFLIGYENRDGIPQYSLITAHQAFLKRAELHPEYDGMKSGIIVQDTDEAIKDLEGDFHLPDQTVVGGWATVYFKNRKIPTSRRLRLARFQKSFGVWVDDPAGMICKCAEADALRSSFPTMLGGLYMREEIDIPMNGHGPAHEPGKLPVLEQGTQQQPVKDAEIVPTATAVGPVKELADYVTGEGFTFGQFVTWAIETGNLETKPESFEQVPEAIAKRLLRAKAGLKKGLEMARDMESNKEGIVQ